ncbi:CHAD domain-containing protein [Solitalea koreensis]|uniref:CHAD domain-containing protein n=1 Tax=Solitalea koreensis TaxID=543615 RepID=A0A521BBU5_9SPHI|nr:CHAD domain-containing protein [Solitalea koreensis]SMO44528.1 CHAD domain-containing protein [Solitalea koreensis]
MLDPYKLCEPLNYNTLLASFSKLEYSRDPEVIHDLRLQLKGIRTVIIFCHTARPSKFPNQKHIPEIKLIFNHLGVIRDYFQSEKLAPEFFNEESFILKAFQGELRASRAKAESELVLLLNLTPIEYLKKLNISLEHQIKKWHDNRKLNRISKKFVHLTQKRIIKLKKRKLTNDHLHEIRKELKRIYLIQAAIHSEESQKPVKELARQLGDLCDLLILKRFLKIFIKANKHNFSKVSNVALNQVIKCINQEIKAVRFASIDSLNLPFEF